MPKYRAYAIKRIWMEASIEASNEDEAMEIYDELISDDFTQVATDWTYEAMIEEQN
jgi:hypothetical protein